MKKNYLFLLVLITLSSCKKDYQEPANNNEDIVKVLASYGYQPLATIPTDVKMPSSITLNEFKQIMAAEKRGKDSINKLTNSIPSDPKLKVTFVDDQSYTDVGSVQSSGPTLITINFPRFGQAGIANTYSGRLLFSGTSAGGVAVLKGTLFYLGGGIAYTWNYSEQNSFGNWDTSSYNVDNTGVLQRMFSISGLAFTRAWTVRLNVHSDRNNAPVAPISITPIPNK